MTWSNRLFNSLNAGFNAFSNTYNGRSLVPSEEFGWDIYQSRLQRYYTNAAYYNATVYSTLNRYWAVQQNTLGLYRHTRSIYNPVQRQNDLLVSYVYGGSLDIEDLSSGAIPIAPNNPSVIEAIKKTFISSRWGELKSLYIRWGAQFGDVALKLIDDRLKQKVRIEVLNPSKIREATFDAVGNITSVSIEYQKLEDSPLPQPGLSGLFNFNPKALRWYVYTEMIDLVNGQTRFRTFKDGQPFAYYADEAGAMVDTWYESWGFVPMVLASHKDVGLRWGASSFHGSLRKMDEINDFASHLNDQVRKSVNALWYFAGVQAQADLVTNDGTQTRDQTPAIYGPEGSQPFAMIGNLPIDQALNVLAKMIEELEKDLPELALQDIRHATRAMTAPGVRAGYSDAIGRIQEARGNYDQALVRALQMAITIGGNNGYEGYAGFTLDSYGRGDLDFSIKDRPVIDDSLALSEELTSLAAVGAQPPAIQRLMLEKLSYSEKEIDSVVNAAEAQQQQQTRQAVRGLHDSLFGNQPNANGAPPTAAPVPPPPPPTGVQLAQAKTA